MKDSPHCLTSGKCLFLAIILQMGQDERDMLKGDTGMGLHGLLQKRYEMREILSYSRPT
jgi:hypothetical protein